MREGELRRGMWVTVEGRVGILVTTGFQQCEVHFTNEAGETAEIRQVRTPRLRPATLDEIPVSRRPQPAE